MVIPSLEIRIPISATEKFMRMLRFFLHSITEFGGPIAQSAHCIVSVSRDTPMRDLYKEYPWIDDYSLEFRWIDEVLFKQYEYDGTGLDRFDIDSDADMILFADADILVAGNFDDVILQSFQTQKLLGFIAHVSPFDAPKFWHISSIEWWQKLYTNAGLSIPQFKHIHTGWGLVTTKSAHRESPYYFNYGFIISPRKYVDQMATSFLKELEIVDQVLDTCFKAQIANTLAFSRHHIPCGTLPINYNFPLHIPHDKIRLLNPDPNGENDLSDVKIFHYLGDGEFNKHQFSSEQSLEEALARLNLSDAGKIFSKKLWQVRKSIQEKDMNCANMKYFSQKYLEPGTKSPIHKLPCKEYIICGGRRTGTTLLTAILCSDKDANSLGQEAQILTRLLEAYRWGRINFDDFGTSFFRQYEAYRDLYRDIVSQFTTNIAARISPGGVLILKNPELSKILLDVIELFPNAKIFSTVRDPRDQICSELEVGSRRDKEGIHDAVYKARDVVSLSNTYMDYYAEILQVYYLKPNNFHIVKYEDMVCHAENFLSSLADITGLKIEFVPTESWKKISPLAALHRGPSRSDLYGTPISHRSVSRYKNELTNEEITTITEMCAPMLETFGYS